MFKEEFQNAQFQQTFITMSNGWWGCRIPYNILMRVWIIAGGVVRDQSSELASCWTCRCFELCYKTQALQKHML